jgi:hypothetical protein
MAWIMNATAEEQRVKAFGNYFTFKPKQIKVIDDNLAAFLNAERKYQGMVSLSEKFEDPQYRDSPEGKQEILTKEAEGLDAYISHLRALVYNNQVSLRQDLEKANLKVDPAALASEGELEAMKLLAKYQRNQEDARQKKVDMVKELMKTVGPVTR